ncbi:MAG: hypothetical protein HY791_17985 [Deltaproteobacteria bacterium]|nr:hypothetical protein [Deltaproteobacteria bacterium]
MELSLRQLQEVRDTLIRRIREGLATHGAQIRALPAYLGPATHETEGRAIVLDTGGTNMRAAVVDLADGRLTIAQGPTEAHVPGVGHRVSRKVFFDAQADLIAALGPTQGLPVGYCFSYPSESQPSRDAKLIRWTKAIDVPDVEGTLVGAGLKAALEGKGLRPGPVAVLNDTVAALLAGSLTLGTADLLGLIAGTGTNIACFVPGSAVPKLTTPFPGDLAINLESGNFHPPHLSAFDDALAASLPDPQNQRFEKAVSGYYLPLVFKQITGRVFESSADLVALAATDDRHAGLAREVLSRSADLIAAALAAVANVRGARHVSVVAEGSLFFGDPAFQPRVEATLRQLIGGQTFSIHRVDHANLAGSAVAALTSFGA